MRYILGGSGFYLVAAWASLTLNFFLPRLMPGDPGDGDVRPVPGHAASRTDRARCARRTDSPTTPLPEQYCTYLNHAFRAISGSRFARFPSPVTEVIGKCSVDTVARRRRRSSSLSLGSAACSALSAPGDAAGSSIRLLPPILIFIGSFPYFWLATVALFFLGFQGWAGSRCATPIATICSPDLELRVSAGSVGTTISSCRPAPSCWSRSAVGCWACATR